MMTPMSVSLRAYAKINLCFEVLGRRDNGLHEVATVMQTIGLADRLTFRMADELTLKCTGMDAAEDNLILRAARLLQPSCATPMGCWIRCVKRIPIGSGMGGGSSDAAATLRALNVLWGLHWPAERLVEAAAALGSDVPFALFGGTALATGTGTEVRQLPDAPRTWLVLVPHGTGDNKTADMYRRLKPSDYSKGSAAEELARGLEQGRIDFAHVRSAFLRPARERWPELKAKTALLKRSGAIAVSISGAGPTLFGLYQSRGKALSGYRQLFRAGTLGLVRSFVPQQTGQVEVRAGRTTSRSAPARLTPSQTGQYHFQSIPFAEW